MVFREPEALGMSSRPRCARVSASVQHDGPPRAMRLQPCSCFCVVGVLTFLCIAPAQCEATPAVQATSPSATWIAEGAPPHDPASARSQASSSRDTGIEGRITIGPSTPVARAGEPNTRPYQATIAVLDADGREVTRFATDADGRFRVLLAPGTYRLRPEARGPFPRGSETVTVTAGTLTHVDIGFDSGIRVPQQRE